MTAGSETSAQDTEVADVVALLAGSLDRCEAVAQVMGVSRYLPIYDIASALNFSGQERVVVDVISVGDINIADRFLMYQYFKYVSLNKFNGFGFRMFDPSKVDEFVSVLDDWVSSALEV